LKLDGLHFWFDRFGLGRPTGIGIAEVSGHLPGDSPIPSTSRRAAAWFAGIGQDQVLATPIQMANVAATIARDGVWLRPRLVSAKTKVATKAERSTTQNASDADVVDLKLSKPALAAAREGMIRVVNTQAGTGRQAHNAQLLVAGKTGSAQASPLKRPLRDELGRIVKDEKGRVQRVPVEPLGTHAAPNPEAPWYRGTPGNEQRIAHAWFIGFAPAEQPKVAFAVLVEYGGSGGAAAGALGGKLVDACIAHGYLTPSSRVTSNPQD
jgi:cell division protein FtsI/penicillin-binding protein 2